jgi:Protein of unknown function (DUF2975)
VQSTNQARLRKIEWISGVLRVICKVVMTFYVFVVLLMLWGMLGGKGHDFMGSNYVSFHIHELPVRDRLIVGGLWALTGAVMFKAVYHLHELLGNYSSGAIFTKESAWQIRQWGFAFILWGLVKFAWLVVPRFVPAAHRVPDSGQFEAVGRIVDGLIIVGISWFMDMAAEIREENELTV